MKCYSLFLYNIRLSDINSHDGNTIYHAATVSSSLLPENLIYRYGRLAYWQRNWYANSTQTVRIQYANGTHTVRKWYANGTHTVRKWYAYSTQAVRKRYAYSTQIVRIQYANGTHTVRKRYASSTHTVRKRYAYSTQMVRKQYAYSTQIVRIRYASSTQTKLFLSVPRKKRKKKGSWLHFRYSPYTTGRESTACCGPIHRVRGFRPHQITGIQ